MPTTFFGKFMANVTTAETAIDYDLRLTPLDWLSVMEQLPPSSVVVPDADGSVSVRGRVCSKTCPQQALAECGRVESCGCAAHRYFKDAALNSFRDRNLSGIDTARIEVKPAGQSLSRVRGI